MKKNDNDFFISISDTDLRTIAAKLAYVLTSGEYNSFRKVFSIPKFKNHFEMEEWRRRHIYEAGKTKGYYFRLEKIANLHQVSIKPNELYYLEDFILMDEFPMIGTNVLAPKKEDERSKLNRIWEQAHLFMRLHKEYEKGTKFTELAKRYTSLMPKDIKKKHGFVKSSMLRKVHSRGITKAEKSKSNY